MVHEPFGAFGTSGYEMECIYLLMGLAMMKEQRREDLFLLPFPPFGSLLSFWSIY